MHKKRYHSFLHKRKLLVNMLNETTLLKSFEYISKYKCPNCLVYNSIDVRQASFKVSPVDNNIFPAGFNNVSRESISILTESLAQYFTSKNAKTVLLITENHTRNAGYLHNINILFEAIKSTGVDARITTLSLDAHTTELTNGTKLNIEKLEIFDGSAGTQELPNPDLIILNNDLSGEDKKSTKLAMLTQMKNVIPSAIMGWNNRKKSEHFKVYDALAKEVAQSVGFDPWLINAEFTTAQCFDFTNQGELTKLADAASDIFKKVKVKYKEYKISQAPGIFLKSESGTYGLGVEKVSDPSDLLNPNRTFRKKILYNKSKISNVDFLLQEAVPTVITHNGKTAECTIYTTFGRPFGGFYRIHGEKNTMDNLNSKGAEFAPLEVEIAKKPSMLTFAAKLSTIAVSMESFV